MNEMFWTNTIWYIFLGAGIIIQLVYIMRKLEHRRMALVFYCTIFGMALYFETVILIFLKSYEYYPMIIQSHPYPVDDAATAAMISRYDDNLTGNLFSQLTVSATALLLVVLKASPVWYIVSGVLYGLIETLFLKLGIYSHNWYRTWMTVGVLPVYFWIVKYMYRKAREGLSLVYQYMYIYFALFPLYIIIWMWGILVLAGIQDYSTWLLADPYNSRHLLFLIHYHIIFVIVLALYVARPGWGWIVAGALALYGLQWAGWRMEWLLMKEGWFWPVATANILWMYGSIWYADSGYGGSLSLGRGQLRRHAG